MWRGRPAISRQSPANARQRGERELRPHRSRLGDVLRVPAVGDARQPLEIRERQAERLADVADGAARAVRREGRDERRVLAAVLLRHADDQLLADVARKVEVDVGHRRQLAVEEAPEREVRRDRVDVREPGQVADERADGRAAAAAGREHVPHRPGPAHLERDLARELEHLPVQQEEAGEAEVADQRELLVEAGEHAPLVAVQPGVALRERALADATELDDRRLVPVGEVGIAVAELLRQVERAAARRARRCARPRHGRPGSARPCRRGRRARTRGCRAARARSRRGRCGSESRRARPGAPRGARRARARRRWRSSGRGASPRARGARRCAARRRARTAAAARRRSCRGRRSRRAAPPRSGRGRRARAARSRTGRRAPRAAPRAAPGRATAAAAPAPPSAASASVRR